MNLRMKGQKYQSKKTKDTIKQSNDRKTHQIYQRKDKSRKKSK